MLYLCIRSFIARTLRLSISRCYNFYFAKPLSSVTFVIVIEFTAFSFDGTSSAASGINVPVLKSAFRSFSDSRVRDILRQICESFNFGLNSSLERFAPHCRPLRETSRDETSCHLIQRVVEDSESS